MLSALFQDNGRDSVRTWIVIISKCIDRDSNNCRINVDRSEGGLRTRAHEMEIASIRLGRMLTEGLAEVMGEKISYYTRVGRRSVVKFKRGGVATGFSLDVNELVKAFRIRDKCGLHTCQIFEVRGLATFREQGSHREVIRQVGV